MKVATAFVLFACKTCSFSLSGSIKVTVEKLTGEKNYQDTKKGKKGCLKCLNHKSNERVNLG